MEEREPVDPIDDEDEEDEDDDDSEAVISADDTGMVGQQSYISEAEERPQ